MAVFQRQNDKNLEHGRIRAPGGVSCVVFLLCLPSFNSALRAVSLKAAVNAENLVVSENQTGTGFDILNVGRIEDPQIPVT